MNAKSNLERSGSGVLFLMHKKGRFCNNYQGLNLHMRRNEMMMIFYNLALPMGKHIKE